MVTQQNIADPQLNPDARFSMPIRRTGRPKDMAFPFEWSEYEKLAAAMRTAKGKVMLSINDHPDIRACFAGLVFHELDIKYSVGNNQGAPKESGELVITNYSPGVLGGLF